MLPLRSTLAPWVYNALRAARFHPKSAAAVAVKQWTLSPAEEETVAPIKLPPSHLEKIGGGPFGESPEQVRAEFTATRVRHEPTEAFLLKNVTLDGPFYFAGLHKGDLFQPAQLPYDSDEALYFSDIRHCALAGTYAGAKWFGHMLWDDLPLQIAAASIAHTVLNARRLYSHETGWRDAFDIPVPTRYHGFFAHEMVVISDFSQNASKKRRLRAMREKVSAAPKALHHRIYLRRPVGGSKRLLVNEDELISVLHSHLGFHIYDPQDQSVEQIIQQCNGADLFVSIEGSHAVIPMFLAAPGARTILMLPPNRVTPLMPKVFRTAGADCALFIGDHHGNGHEEFTVNPQELVRFIDSLDTRNLDPII